MLAGLTSAFSLSAQHGSEEKDYGQIHGNYEMTTQMYNQDSVIGAIQPDEKMLLNAYANIIYTKGRFSAGIRYETYQNALLGYDPRYNGSGIPYRYATYNGDKFQFTVGNFYEQFGYGFTLRTYEASTLGLDNSIDGIRIKANPLPGIYVKGVYGRQRTFFTLGQGIVRGADGEILVNELSEKLGEMKTNITVGGSFVSKYEADLDNVYNLPENVATWGGRIGINRGKVGLYAEYAYKMNDPNKNNNFIYKPGEAYYVSATYATRGLGATIAAKMNDNMGFRSERADNSLTQLQINYLPTLTRQHSYNLAATLYPYTVQPNGEFALQTDIAYKVPKKSALGGRYGMDITLNASFVYALDSTALNDLEGNRLGYQRNSILPGKEKYYKDINLELRKKFTKKFWAAATYMNLEASLPIVLGKEELTDLLKAHIGVIEAGYKFTSKKMLRIELQTLQSNEDQGSWYTGLLELTLAPKWFFSIMDQYNVGTSKKPANLHYPVASVGFIHHSLRVTTSYGRQRAGLFCVGGICRVVPASNGLTLSITNSF